MKRFIFFSIICAQSFCGGTLSLMGNSQSFSCRNKSICWTESNKMRSSLMYSISHMEGETAQFKVTYSSVYCDRPLPTCTIEWEDDQIEVFGNERDAIERKLEQTVISRERTALMAVLHRVLPNRDTDPEDTGSETGVS